MKEYANSSGVALIQLDRLVPVFVELGEAQLQVFKCLPGLLDALAVPVQVGVRQLGFQRLHAGLGLGDLGFEVVYLAVGEFAFAFRLALVLPFCPSASGFPFHGQPRCS